MTVLDAILDLVKDQGGDKAYDAVVELFRVAENLYCLQRRLDQLPRKEKDSDCWRTLHKVVADVAPLWKTLSGEVL